jgi:hypothetical protein
MTIEEDLVTALRDVKHCGDYGNLWWQPGTGTAFLNMGDADGQEEFGWTAFDTIETLLRAVPGVEHVIFGDEQDPTPEEGWMDLGVVGQEYWGAGS